MKLVTGGSGVIGRALVKKLIQKGEMVRIYDLSPPPIKDPNIEFIRGDIKDPKKVMEACKGVDTVFHLAGKMPQARLDEKGFSDPLKSMEFYNFFKGIVKCISHFLECRTVTSFTFHRSNSTPEIIAYLREVFVFNFLWRYVSF